MGSTFIISQSALRLCACPCEGEGAFQPGNLKRASDSICDAVESLLTVAEKCPRYATIPVIVRQALPGADDVRETVGPMSSEEFTERIKSLMMRESRKVVGRERLAPGFLRQMMRYASHCKNEAGRIPKNYIATKKATSAQRV